MFYCDRQTGKECGIRDASVKREATPPGSGSLFCSRQSLRMGRQSYASNRHGERRSSYKKRHHVYVQVAVCGDGDRWIQHGGRY